MVRDDVLQVLEQHKGELVSGGMLAQKLSVSRTAIWKAISTLRDEGFPIESVAGGGYRLSMDSDALSAAGIQLHLTTGCIGQSLEVFSEIDSTNNYLKRKAGELPHGHTAVADCQTAGRGRRGRSFLSPSGSGVYLSILLHPTMPLEQINLITVGAAVAICHAIQEAAGFSPSIKWVNDVLQDGKKLCGILTEASVEAETGLLSYAIVGIGINVRTPEGGLPEEIRSIAGSLEDFAPHAVSRNQLVACFLNHMERCYDRIAHGQTAALMEDYRSYMHFLGQEIRIITGDAVRPARALTINEHGHLIVEQDGERRELLAGEISIRLDEQTDIPK
ncbi:MAG: biotin--[acetyl-CoA-carboxylase] ligase [Butyricicoccus sp.]